MPTTFDRYFKHFNLKIFFVNFKKCVFAQDHVIFLGFIVFSKGVATDLEKVRTITTWPTPHNVHEVRSFHGLASFYRRFVRGFSSIMAPITECTKKGPFLWTSAAQQAFMKVKKLFTKAPILEIPNFEAAFELACDASHSGIGGVLSQQGHLVAYFSEKLNEARRHYSTYDLELYTLVQSIKHWCHYLMHCEFLLFSDHDSLRHLNAQKKLNARHARWVNFLHHFTFVLHHKAGVENTVADALSRKSLLLTTLSLHITCFDTVKGLYPKDLNFGTLYVELLATPNKADGHHSIIDDFLFRGT
jgi:hypothetical protein